MAELVMAAVSRGVQAAADAQLSQLARVGALAVGQMTAAARSKLAEARPLVALPPLPPPMVTGNYEANATSCHLQVWVRLAGRASASGALQGSTSLQCLCNRQPRLRKAFFEGAGASV